MLRFSFCFFLIGFSGKEVAFEAIKCIVNWGIFVCPLLLGYLDKSFILDPDLASFLC